MRTIPTIVLAMFLVLQANAQSTTANLFPFITDGDVNTIVNHQGRTYIGGSFYYVGPQTPYGTALNASNGLAVDLDATSAISYFVKPNDVVHVAVSDGNNGWYIGGKFTTVGGTARNRLARIKSDGTLDADWNPNASGPVYALAVSGGKVYIGGGFTSINGSTTRNRLAAVDATSGTVDADWNPNASDTVRAIAVRGSSIYVGGDFNGANSINGSQTRNYMAEVNNTNGNVTSFNPNANGTVRAIAVGSYTVTEGDPPAPVTKTRVFVGGDFTGIGGAVDRNYIASFELGSDNTTHTLTSWNPNADRKVKTITVSGTRVYVGGEFWNIGAGGGFSLMSAFDNDATGAQVTTWNASLGVGVAAGNASVNAIVINGSEVVAGGQFRGANGIVRRNIVALPANSTGLLSSTWKGASSDEVFALAVSGSRVYAGGQGLSVGGQNRKRVASFLQSTSTLSDWNPELRTVNTINISAIVVDPAYNRLYIGGEGMTGVDFLNLDGSQISTVTDLSGLAAFDMSTNPDNPPVVSSWKPVLAKTASGNANVYAMALAGNNLFVGGDFTSINSSSRKRLAAFKRSNGGLQTWDPSIEDGNVFALAVRGTTLYMGGDFTTINTSATYAGLASYNASADIPTITSWKPKVVTTYGYIPRVNTIATSADGGTVYIGGQFEWVTPAPSGDNGFRDCLAAIDAASGVATGWTANLNRSMGETYFAKSILLSGNILYVGGRFGVMSSYNVANLGAVYTSSNTGNAVNWNPGVMRIGPLQSGSGVNALAIVGSDLVAGGGILASNFTTASLASYALSSISVSWGGSNGGNWNDENNWSPQVVPTSSTDAIEIALGYPVMNTDFIVGAASGTAKTLTISGSGSLEIAAGYRFSVAATGTADFGGKSVTLRSTSDGTASIGQVLGTLSNASKVTVERYIPLGRKWRMLTAPLTGSTNNSVFYNWQRNGATPANGTGVEIWGPAGGTNIATGAANSLLSFDNGWVNVNNTNTALLFDGTTNNAYALFVTAPYGGGNIATGAAATTLSATGTLITGDHTKSFSSATAGQYLLVGNPYASPVNPASFTTGAGNRTNLDNAIYLWDAKQTGINNVGRYVTFDIQAGTYSIDGGEASVGYSNSPTTQIQSGQAFFVKVSNPVSSTPSIRFQEASKSSTGSHFMLGNSTTEKRQYIRVQLSRDSTILDGVVTFFEPGGAAAVDATDALKMMNSSENLGLRRDGQTLVFEHRPELKSADTLYIALTQMRQASYKLSLRCFGITAEEGVSLELVDNHTQQRREISALQANEVEFTVDAQSASSGERFMIVLKKKAAAGNTTEPASSAKMKPYPNPVTGSTPVRIDIDRERAPWGIRLVDVSGRTVWSRSRVDAAEGHVEIDMSGLRSGAYNVVMTDGRGRRSVSKVVKQ